MWGVKVMPMRGRIVWIRSVGCRVVGWDSSLAVVGRSNGSGRLQGGIVVVVFSVTWDVGLLCIFLFLVYDAYPWRICE